MLRSWVPANVYNNIQGAAFVWIADMDVDCDGIDYKCKVSWQEGRKFYKHSR